jgi:hypothetical protein
MAAKQGGLMAAAFAAGLATGGVAGIDTTTPEGFIAAGVHEFVGGDPVRAPQ